MTDANLMDADCIHGIPWYECDDCTTLPPEKPAPPAYPNLGKCQTCGMRIASMGHECPGDVHG